MARVSPATRAIENAEGYLASSETKPMWEALTTTVLVVSGAASLFALIDFLMLKSQRERLKDKAANIWIWLSYQRSMPYLAYLTKPKMLMAIIIFESLVLLISNAIIVPDYIVATVGAVIIDIFILLVVIWLIRPYLGDFLSFIANPPTLWLSLLKLERDEV